MKTELHCRECGETNLEKWNVNGNFSGPWQDFPRVFLTKDFDAFVCKTCENAGKFAIVGSDAEVGVLDKALEASVRDQASQFIEKIMKEGHISLTRLAKWMGVSKEQFTSIFTQEETPSFQLWNFLKIIAIEPKLRLEGLDPEFDFTYLLKSETDNG
jgi:hypothetical protein